MCGSGAIVRDGCDDTRLCRQRHWCRACAGHFDAPTGPDAASLTSLVNSAASTPRPHGRIQPRICASCANWSAAATSPKPRVQELNRKIGSFASPAVAASIIAHVACLDEQIKAVMDAARNPIAAHPILNKNLALLGGIDLRGLPDISRLWRDLGHHPDSCRPQAPGLCQRRHPNRKTTRFLPG